MGERRSLAFRQPFGFLQGLVQGVDDPVQRGRLPGPVRFGQRTPVSSFDSLGFPVIARRRELLCGAQQLVRQVVGSVHIYDFSRIVFR